MAEQLFVRTGGITNLMNIKKYEWDASSMNKNSGITNTKKTENMLFSQFYNVSRESCSIVIRVKHR